MNTTSITTLLSTNSISKHVYDIAQEENVVRVLVYLLYSIIFILGVLGNSLVVYVVLHNKNMQTITNIFIANLAFSDILMCLVAVPFTPMAIYMKNFTLPAAVCKILPMTMGVSVYVSTLTSTAIAVDRYFVIVHPFIPRMKTWLCVLIILSVWVISLLISMPLAVYQSKHVVVNNTDQFICTENWPEEATRKVFTMVSFVLQFLVPCFIIIICYVKVSVVLRTRFRTKIGSGTKSRMKEEIEIKRKRRTNKMLIAMVTIFVVCWIPLNVLWMVSDCLHHFINTTYFTLVFFLCHIVAMSSVVYNPFLYAWLNENFKKEFHSVLPCLFQQAVATDLMQLSQRDSRVYTNYRYSNTDHEEAKGGGGGICDAAGSTHHLKPNGMMSMTASESSLVERNNHEEAKVALLSAASDTLCHGDYNDVVAVTFSIAQ